MNKITVIIILVNLFVFNLMLISCYNFADREFNEILASDLQDVADSLDSMPLNSHRIRRSQDTTTTSSAVDDKCRRRRRRPRVCCADESLDFLHDNEKELHRECFKEITGNDKVDHHRGFDPFSCEEATKRRNDMTCIVECVGKKKGLVDESGNLQPDQIIKYLKQSFAKDSWLQTAVPTIVDDCLEDVRNASITTTTTSDNKSCNSAALTMKHCIFKEVQLSCPADQIKDKKFCEKFQERIKKGIDLFEPPPPPPSPTSNEE